MGVIAYSSPEEVVEKINSACWAAEGLAQRNHVPAEPDSGLTDEETRQIASILWEAEGRVREIIGARLDVVSAIPLRFAPKQ